MTKRALSAAAHGSSLSYTIGFLLSLLATFAAYILVTNHINSHHKGSHKLLIALIVGFALAQLLVQLVFFLHLGKESRPRWNLMAFLFAVVVVVILVFGSLWIMSNLDYHMMSPQETDSQIMEEEGIHRH